MRRPFEMAFLLKTRLKNIRFYEHVVIDSTAVPVYNNIILKFLFCYAGSAICFQYCNFYT